MFVLHSRLNSHQLSYGSLTQLGLVQCHLVLGIISRHHVGDVTLPDKITAFSSPTDAFLEVAPSSVVCGVL